MGPLRSVARAIDAINEAIGRVAWWLAIVLVLVQFAVVVLRYVFSTSFIVAQESVIYAHATLFMLGIGYTLLHDGHVRVDLLYGEAAPRTRAWIDLAGTLVAIVPFCLLVLWVSWPFVWLSWSMREGPIFAGGIPYQYALKTLIPAFAVLVLLQAVSIVLRALLVIRGEETEVFASRIKEQA